MKINSGKESRNIADNHSTILIIKILLKFTENVQKNHIIFWQETLHYQTVIL